MYIYACVYAFVHLCVYTRVYVYVYAYNVGQKQPGCWSPTDRCWSPSARDVGSQAQDGHTLMTLVHGFVVEQTDLTSLKQPEQVLGRQDDWVSRPMLVDENNLPLEGIQDSDHVGLS